MRYTGRTVRPVKESHVAPDTSRSVRSGPGTIEDPQTYLYTFVCHEDEVDLCRLELRTLFRGAALQSGYLRSALPVDPSRSPFIKQQLAVMYTGGSLEDIARQAEALELEGATFKVTCVEADDAAAYAEQRAIERQLGARIRGRAEMRKPQRLFGIARAAGQWLFGECRNSEPLWLRHNAKPHHYSTALSTRVARAVANIAVPHPPGVKAIDPCCGIGTVLIEALSMGVDIVGRDINPLAVRGARANLQHYGFPDVVAVGDINMLQGCYDMAILDLPYNLCSKLSQQEQLEMLRSARRLAERAVVIATETIDSALEQAGFCIQDRCVVKKGSFMRHILLCS